MRKILYSPDFGAGWYTWNPGEMGKYMLTHEATIKAVESGKGLKEALEALTQECQQKFGDTPYLGGADSLEVMEVKGRVRIHEYDGSETVEEEGSFEGWI